ncbi:MAG: alpha-L-fucosidase, partial [Gammaproteobacteria bacterium]
AKEAAGNNLALLATPSGNLPPAEDFHPWEACMTINGNWGYNKDDHGFKSTKSLIQTLADIASKGGNLLLDVGPTPDGTIQSEFAERLRGMGAWLKVNGASIYGTTFGPWQDLPFGRSTRNGSTVYLHVFNWRAGQLEVEGVAEQASSVRLLATGQSLHFHQAGGRLRIDTPASAPDENDAVLAILMR